VCETWSLILRKDHRLKVFKNRALRRIFGPKRDAMVDSWRTFHSEKLHNLYTSPNIIRMIKPRRIGRGGHLARTGKNRNAYTILMGKAEGKNH
jgi:hypothetical protein